MIFLSRATIEKKGLQHFRHGLIFATQARFRHASPFSPRESVFATQARFRHAKPIFATQVFLATTQVVVTISILQIHFWLQLSAVNNARIET